MRKRERESERERERKEREERGRHTLDMFDVPDMLESRRWSSITG